MLIEITSDHPNFLDILGKNPDTFRGIQLRKIKNGTGIGNVVDAAKYELVFQDTKYSFSTDTSNQIDFQSYCNPRAVLTLVSEFLRHILVDKDSWDAKTIPWLADVSLAELEEKPGTHTLRIESLYADGFSRHRGFVLEKYFSEIKLEHKVGCLYTMTVTCDTIHRLVNLTAIVCMYMAATNGQPWFLNRDLVRKYIRIMKNIQPVPYFVLYLFAKRCIRSADDFSELKGELASAFDGELNLTWGNSQEMRIREVGKRLVDSEGMIPGGVIEVGCGEMDYPRRFARKLKPEAHWFSIDKEDYSHLVDRINRKLGDEKVFFIHEGNDPLNYPPGKLPDSGRELPGTTLMVEVIEHMPYDEANFLIQLHLPVRSGDRLIVTTPNRSFNKHFGFDREFRHDDHHFELTGGEFKALISKAILEAHFGDPPEFDLDFFGIGDEVEGEHLSLGCEIILA